MIKRFCDMCDEPAFEKHGLKGKLPDGTEFYVRWDAGCGSPGLLTPESRDIDLCLSCLVEVLELPYEPGDTVLEKDGPLLRDKYPEVIGYEAGANSQGCARCDSGHYNHTH